MGEAPDQVAVRWSQDGYSCNLWVDPPGQVWTDFVHPVDELVYVVEGELEMTVSGVTSRMVAGQECHIPAGAVHTLKNVGGVTARWLYGYRRGWTPPPLSCNDSDRLAVTDLSGGRSRLCKRRGRYMMRGLCQKVMPNHCFTSTFSPKGSKTRASARAFWTHFCRCRRTSPPKSCTNG